ncbi:MAG: hypothetical protein JSW54_04475 [Fidelibacterota bacterium]|nr:MAG: hypothetical protein JSW54_04475 [Candidatus Neomarinimicrobiota bacterium]
MKGRPSSIPTPMLLAIILMGGLQISYGQDDIPDSPENIRPLMVGATIPELTLTTMDGEPFHLMTAVESQPTVLIFYRGSW